MDTKGIRVNDLLNYLPDTLLDELAVETRADHQVKKLSGKFMFKLLLYGVLNTTRLSLNVLVSLLESALFRAQASVEPDWKTRRNSLADRLATVKADYFAKLLERVSTQFSSHFADPGRSCGQGRLPYLIKRFDSTTVSLSSELLSMGMVNGAKPKDESKRLKQLKFTIGFDGLTVSDFQLYTQQSYLAEDRALGEAIQKSSVSCKEVVVFDRGLKKRKTFRQFSEQGRLFVTRINPTTMYEQVGTFSQSAGRSTDTLELVSDRMVYLYANGNLLKCPFRLILARSLGSGETLYFLTNIFHLKAAAITDIYRMRWEIELLFRFLKQEMNFSHLLSRHENGIRVMVYVTLIAAMLVLVYRKLNQMSGYKIPKLRFSQELQTDIIRQIVILCNGNPELLEQVIPSG